MTLGILSKKAPKAGRSKLQEITISGFAGGWNTIQEDVAMDQHFLANAKNVRRSPSAGMVVRYGSQWFADMTGVIAGDHIVDGYYFANKIIVVSDAGEIGTIDNEGLTAAIWNTTIAAALPGAPDGWTTGQTLINFVPFRNELEIHNGQDKPVTVANDFTVTYLQDLATGSNVNVPIGKYGTAVSNFHCVAGIDGQPTTVFISSSGTAGTWPNDGAPNDSISIDVGAYVSEGGDAIRGLAGYKSFLLVFFQSYVLPVKLGGFDDSGNHVPEFPDTLPKFGLLNHRTIVALPNDIQFGDIFGLGSGKRNVFSSLVDTQHLSEYIEPDWRSQMGAMTEEQRSKNCFAIYDPLAYSTLIIVPNGTALVFTQHEKLRYKAWTYYQAMSFTWGCTSTLGRTFAGTGMKVFQFGNSVYAGEKYYADRQLDRDFPWANNISVSAGNKCYDASTQKSYTAQTDFITPSVGTFENERVAQPLRWVEYTGEAVDFDIEGPWFTGKEQMRVKQLRFTSIVTKGTAPFTFEVYVDNLYKDDNGGVIFPATIALDFVGNDAGGWGSGGPPYGGGRRSRDPRLYRTPCRFKTLKTRMYGSVKEKLEINGLSFLYAQGKYKR